MGNADLLQLGAGFLGGGALLTLTLARQRRLCGWAATLCAAAAAIAVYAVVVRAFLDREEAATLLAIPALGAQLAVAVDKLSAFFLAIAATIWVVSTLFSVRYMEHFASDSVAKFYPVLLVFSLAIVGVLVSVDMLFFLVFWELMTLTSYFLVTFERESRESQRAGLKYFIITHAATLCLVAAVLILWRQAGSFDFAAQRQALAQLIAERPVIGHLVILLFLLGFTTKAGLLPMGDWLPDAHPVAPSGMSAMLSGALVKLGVYGLVRVFCTLVPSSAGLPTWGTIIAVAGTASLFIGNITALGQSNTKRLMAFSTIGQIGYICLALGVGIAALPSYPALAALGLVAGLLHAANHACFKACLFLGAGAVLYRTGEREMDRLGGLGGAMPITAGCSAIAALSISGVPPLNGFASKWLIVVTCLVAGLSAPLFLVLGLVALFVSLASLGAYLKVMGATFLGQPMPEREVREVPASMLVPQLVLAALCVLLGVLPQAPLGALHSAVAEATALALPPAGTLFGGAWGLTVSIDGTTIAVWAPLAFLGGLGLLALLAYGIQRAGGASVRRVEVWTCGEQHAPQIVRYPARSLYAPFKRALARIYPRLALRAPRMPEAVRRALDVDRWLYGPAVQQFERAARGVSRSHVGTPQVYLLWIAAGAVFVVGILVGALGP